MFIYNLATQLIETLICYLETYKAGTNLQNTGVKRAIATFDKIQELVQSAANDEAFYGDFLAFLGSSFFSDSRVLKNNLITCLFEPLKINNFISEFQLKTWVLGGGIGGAAAYQRKEDPDEAFLRMCQEELSQLIKLIDNQLNSKNNNDTNTLEKSEIDPAKNFPSLLDLTTRYLRHSKQYSVINFANQKNILPADLHARFADIIAYQNKVTEMTDLITPANKKIIKRKKSSKEIALFNKEMSTKDISKGKTKVAREEGCSSATLESTTPEVEEKTSQIQEVKEIKVAFVFDPPRARKMMSDEGSLNSLMATEAFRFFTQQQEAVQTKKSKRSREEQNAGIELTQRV